ncbi:MAG: A/G-specific adenine glycosylase, partial [Methanoregulaceae archaeon]|nr:A/G-specific adenine glycosylase [Methanoregulaceae archaeon]
CAIRAFAWNRPVVFIETNIRRVFLHCFFPGGKDVSDREILPLVGETLDRDDPREWYYALMDYGTHLKRSAGNPNLRSRHYRRQSTFGGSDRQIRGLILRIVLAEPGIMLEDLLQKAGDDRGRSGRILENLIEEGFLSDSDGRIAITG